MNTRKKLSGALSSKRSFVDYLRREIYERVFVVLTVVSVLNISHGFTDPRDVFAMNSLYAALGYPPILRWIPNGGDPCLELWQGVQCVNSNITGIILDGVNLGGNLGDNLGSFSSIITLDLSNNHITGNIPSNLPLTMKNFLISDNQFNGSIPSTISSLSQLTDMSLNNNNLTGEIPDAFQSLKELINLDLSGNNLSGKLPPSLENLSSLMILHLQNNQLSGTLDVLQDLPLTDLNIENNLFSGPIPGKLLIIPKFKKDGNPFNTTIAPSSSTQPPVSGASSSKGPSTDVPSTTEAPDSVITKKSLSTKRLIWIAVAGVLILIIIVLVFAYCISKFCNVNREAENSSKKHEIGAYTTLRREPQDSDYLAQPNNQIEKVAKETLVGPKDTDEANHGIVGAIPKPQDEQKIDIKRTSPILKQKAHGIDATVTDVILMPSVPAPYPTTFAVVPPADKVILNPIMPIEVSKGRPPVETSNDTISLRPFTIASLQQYTNNFCEENYIGRGILGSTYRAELPDGKLLAVKKLDNEASRRQNDEDFLELVSRISRLRHDNIVELVGYCVEHGQRLLIYEYCSSGTLHDMLQSYSKVSNDLSWNSRVRIALGAARALEYLHEVCQPPLVHQNFKSANILLDDNLGVHVSDCGLASLISSIPVSQLPEDSVYVLSSYGYGASESGSGTCTHRSDVYSFGVVMLELLTGRMSYDRSQPRGRQFLVRWVVPQLHDIDALSRMVDPNLSGAYPAKSLSRFADIISLCVQPVPEFRPPMSEIVQDLLDLIQRES